MKKENAIDVEKYAWRIRLILFLVVSICISCLCAIFRTSSSERDFIAHNDFDIQLVYFMYSVVLSMLSGMLVMQ